jgi:uncharacterized protein (DUF305 family)
MSLRALSCVAGLLLGCAGSTTNCPDVAAPAAEKGGASTRHWDGPFVASSDRPVDEQMMETMARMDQGMAAAPMTGDPDRDFVTMMIPHHQGGIDMAKVMLVLGKDPEAIVTDQQNEIELMQLWLARHPAVAVKATEEKTP